MASSCRLSCDRCALSGDEALKAVEVCRFATRNLLGLHHSILTDGALDGSSTGSEDGVARGRVGELMVDALSLLATCSAHHDNVNTALARVADKILASVDATCGTAADGAGASARPECAPAPSHAAAASIAAAAAAATAQPPSVLSDSSRVVMLRGADGNLSVPMPLVGLGTWLTTGAESEKLVAVGLAAGIRAIDGSENYLNSDAIGRAVEASKIPRGELFLASKLSHASSYSKSGARAALKTQLEAMRTSYLDLFMLHSVGPSLAAMREAWSEMKAMQHEGLVRAIGVSNFQIHDLDNLLAFDNAAGGPPYDDTARGDAYADTAGGAAYADAAAEGAYADTARGRAYDDTARGPAYDDTALGDVYDDDTAGGRAYNNTVGGHAYDTAGGHAYVDTARGHAHDNTAGGSPLAMLQNKFSPYHLGSLHTGGRDYAQYCRDKGIALVAYCPLNAWPSALSPLNDLIVAHIALKLKRTPAQVM
jgi:diketogulonate reductase-like aldo/keto reductase